MLTSIFSVNFANITLESKYQPANLDLFLSEVLDKLSVLRKEIEFHNKGRNHFRLKEWEKRSSKWAKFCLNIYFHFI